MLIPNCFDNCSQRTSCIGNIVHRRQVDAHGTLFGKNAIEQKLQHLNITRFRHFNGLADKLHLLVPQESLGNGGRPVS